MASAADSGRRVLTRRPYFAKFAPRPRIFWRARRPIRSRLGPSSSDTALSVRHVASAADSGRRVLTRRPYFAKFAPRPRFFWRARRPIRSRLGPSLSDTALSVRHVASAADSGRRVLTRRPYFAKFAPRPRFFWRARRPKRSRLAPSLSDTALSVRHVASAADSGTRFCAVRLEHTRRLTRTSGAVRLDHAAVRLAASDTVTSHWLRLAGGQVPRAGVAVSFQCITCTHVIYSNLVTYVMCFFAFCYIYIYNMTCHIFDTGCTCHILCPLETSDQPIVNGRRQPGGPSLVCHQRSRHLDGQHHG